MADRDASLKILSDNRQARHNYFLMERFEAGLVLTGTEVKAAKDGKFDVIVMGTKGRSTLGDVLVGSVAQRVLAITQLPVTFVK